MKRSILGLIVGLAVWVLVASLNRSLRFGLEGYAATEQQMTFTHAMMAARLAVGALASLAAGAVTRAVAPSSPRVLWVFGAAPGCGVSTAASFSEPNCTPCPGESLAESVSEFYCTGRLARVQAAPVGS